MRDRGIEKEQAGSIRRSGVRSKIFGSMDKGALANSDMKQTKYIILYIVMVLFMIVYGMIVFIPSLWMLVSGFKEPAELYAMPAHFFPKELHLSKLLKILGQVDFKKYYINTTVMALGVVASDIVVCGLAGYVLSRLKPKGSKIILMMCFCLMLIPATMGTVPLYKSFLKFPIGHFNLMNTYVPMWIMAGANVFDIMLFKTSFDGIPNSLVEAAKIDGASNIRIFFRIILPLSVPIVVTVGILAFNSQFGSFFWPMLLLRNDEVSVLGLLIYKLRESTMTMDYKMLSLLFSIFPQILVFAVFQRYIIGGVNIGSVKG